MIEDQMRALLANVNGVGGSTRDGAPPRVGEMMSRKRGALGIF
jgi:hypothetical protein